MTRLGKATVGTVLVSASCLVGLALTEAAFLPLYVQLVDEGRPDSHPTPIRADSANGIKPRGHPDTGLYQVVQHDNPALPPDGAVRGVPARIGADVRIDGRRVVYEKAPPCRPAAGEPFFLHVTPSDANDLADAGQRALNFDNIVFPDDFWRAEGDRCVGEHPLPNYDVARLRTGQFDPATGDATWEASFREGDGTLDAAPLPADAVLGAQLEPATGDATWVADFPEGDGANRAAPRPDGAVRGGLSRVGADVRIDGGRVVYAKAPPCLADPGEPLFLHVAPSDVNDLADEGRRALGFDNIVLRDDFWRAEGNGCVGEHALPNYDVAHLRTGQFDPETGVVTWAANFVRGGLSRVGADVRIDGGRVVYAKAPPCLADPGEPLFLHVAPSDVNDLADEGRRALGFDNIVLRDDFWRAEGNGCVGEHALPNYDVAHLRIGQFDPETGVATWAVNFEGASARPAPRPDGDVRRPRDRVGADVRIEGSRVVYEGSRVVYAKAPPCLTDPGEPFFLHVAPSDANDLADEGRRLLGFDNIVFPDDFWRAEGDRCVGEHVLPNYDVAHLRTGQFDPETGVATWEANFHGP